MALAHLQNDVETITCYCNAAVTAGDFVKVVANDDSVTSSGVSSFAGNEIKIEAADANTDYAYVIGIAGEDGSSTDLIKVHTEGLFIIKTSEAITAGVSVQVAEQNSEEDMVEALDSGEADHKVGKALTSASATDKYIVMLLRV